jgi:predicted alpha/beta superfamily hydrolase
MKKIQLIYILCCCLFTVNAQKNTDIIIGKIDSLNSTILNEQRNIWIHVPEGSSSELFEQKKYPVVYLLDGDAHFTSVVGMIQNLSFGVWPEMIVVGIPNTNRWRDLTPTKAKLDPSMMVDSTIVANTGGGENFMSFIEKELVPFIDSKYPTDSYRMLIGHSLGGLIVLNTLIDKPDLFNSYVAIDPSMSWDDKNLLNKIKKTPLDKKFRNKKLFLGIANTMSKGMDTVTVQKDTTKTTAHIRAILELNTYLNNDTQKQLSYKGKYYKDDSHGSAPLITEYDAMRHFFDFYELKLDEQDYLDPTSDIVAKYENHYKRLSKEFGREMKPEDDMVNGLGYQFMNMKHYEKAKQFFKLNVKNYPESFNVYDSLGDLYVATENKEKAIESYKKALALTEYPQTRQKLNKLME